MLMRWSYSNDPQRFLSNKRPRLPVFLPLEEILCTEDLATHDIDIPDIPDFVVPQQAEASTVPQDDFVIPDVPDFYVNNGAIPENPGNDL